MKRMIHYGATLVLLISMPAGLSLSQTRGSRTPADLQRQQIQAQRRAEQQRRENEQRMEESKRRAEQHRLEYERKQEEVNRLKKEYADEVYQEILGATRDQWRRMKPYIERIRELQKTPRIHASVYAFAAGGSQHSESYEHYSGYAPPSGGSTSSGTGGGGGGWAGAVSGGGGGVGGSAAGGAGGRLGLSSGGTAGVGGRVVSGGGGSYSGANSAGGGGYMIGTPGPTKKQIGDVGLGWEWMRLSEGKTPNELAEGERACEELLDVLEAKSASPEQIRGRVEALRQIRWQRQQELEEVRRWLLEIVTPEQEAKLILMDYLD